MSVAFSCWTVRLKIRPGQQCERMFLSGSIPELGSWSERNAVPMVRDANEKGGFSLTLSLSEIVPSFKFRYIGEQDGGTGIFDLRRCFQIPEEFVKGHDFSSTGKVFIEMSSVWNEARSSVSVFVPSRSVPKALKNNLNITHSLAAMQKVLGDLRREKDALRVEISSLSAALFAEKESESAKLAEVQSNRVIKALLLEINELKGKVKVVGRFRPLIEGESEALDYAISRNSSVVVRSSEFSEFSPLPGRSFQLDDVFDGDVDNENFFEMSKIKSVVESSVMIGNNVCIFSYGQTNSGKSHTVIGSRGERGIVELTLDSVFGLIEKQERQVEIEMIEIYRESVFQLIDRTQVSSKAETMELFLERIRERATACTQLNPSSSRSHCVFILTLWNETDSNSIFIVDLAGSERTKISGAEGDRLAEANSINKSLSSLGLVLNSLLNKRPFIPYRDSKLTKILAPVFTVSKVPSKVVMVANVSPHEADERETISTLNFAQRVGEIELRDNRENEEAVNRKIQNLNQLIDQEKVHLDQLSHFTR